jgi:transposase-like protein
LEEMMLERGLKVDHSTINRWVHKYAPELDKRCRPHLKPTNDSYRVDETYIKVKGNWTYLYRAVDSKGDTIEFMLSEHRDAKSAERFFEKALGSPHSADPRVINVDKNAAYPPAMAALKKNDLVEEACKLRQVKYLNNIVEQDHRFIKRRVAPGLGFASFPTAERTLRGYEAMNMIRKGQVEGVTREDIAGQVQFIENLFGIAA